ncbi:hypothetical protein HOH87_07120 [bacterium]|nr:hypothetical protein [bacterium]
MADMNETLLTLFYNDHKEQLMWALFDIIQNGTPEPPFVAILEIVEHSTDIELMGLSMEYLYLNYDRYFMDLVKLYTASESQAVHYALILVFSLHSSLLAMDFLIGEYLQNVDYRPMIRKVAFRNKLRLLMGLTYYTESNHLSDLEELVVQDILTTIPRYVFGMTGGTLAIMKIMDLYIAIPPDKRNMASAPPSKTTPPDSFPNPFG